MSQKPFRLQCPRLLAADELERIHAAALRVLGEHGIHLHHSGALEAAARAGLRVRGDRVYPDRSDAAAFTRDRAVADSPVNPTENERPAFTLHTGQYATHAHDLETDRLVPLTVARVVEAAKLVDSLADRGVVGGAPGCPLDVAPELQSILQYKIQAENCRHGRRPVDPRQVRSLPYVMDMAEVLGRPLRELPVYIVSPLALGGESLECVLKYRHRLDAVWTSNMSSVGATAPVRIADALALAVAEALGAAVVLEAVTNLPVEWSLDTVAFDLRAMAMSFGSPEFVLFRRACQEVDTFCHGRPLGAPEGAMRSQAKIPDAQAAAEKMAGAVIGALFGATGFNGGGTLSLDEVFSAEQLVVDCELRDYAQRLAAGVDGECDEESCVQQVAEGLEGGFLGLESTAAQYRRIYWLPHIFERRSLAGWLNAGEPEMRARATQIARESIQRHDFHLDAETARELDAVYRRAEREFGG